MPPRRRSLQRRQRCDARLLGSGAGKTTKVELFPVSSVLSGLYRVWHGPCIECCKAPLVDILCLSLRAHADRPERCPHLQPRHPTHLFSSFMKPLGHGICSQVTDLAERLSLAETGAADAREQLTAASQQLTAARAQADSAAAQLREAEVCKMRS